MLPFEDRHTRQRRLPEIGYAGQRRLDQAHTVLHAGPGAEAEYEYLSRAGVQCEQATTPAQATPFPHTRFFRHRACANFAGGAWRALRSIRQIALTTDSGSTEGPVR